MFVKVSVKLPAGVHLKLLVADILNEPSLSVVTVPTALADTVTVPVNVPPALGKAALAVVVVEEAVALTPA